MADDLAAIVAGNIAVRRRAAKLTGGQLASKAGTGRAHLNQIEHAVHVPSTPLLARIAAALGCTAADLLTEPACRWCFGAPPPGYTCSTCGTATPQAGAVIPVHAGE